VAARSNARPARWRRILGVGGFTLGVTIVAVSLETVIGMIMALMMHKAFKGRGVVRAAITHSVGDPDGGQRQAVAGHLRAERRGGQGSRSQHHLVGGVAGPDRPSSSPTPGRPPRSLALLILAGLQGIPDEALRVREGGRGPARGSGSGGSRCHWSSPPWPSLIFRSLDTLRM
jgi:multiple sugar transport system permease protein